MAYINDTLKTATIALANFAASGAIGTAATTVDTASSFVITQTTAGIALTIPSPTNTTAGDRLRIGSSSASTANITVAGAVLQPGEFQDFSWSGTAWLSNDGGRNMGAVVSVATIAAGNSVVTHNLSLPAGQFSSVVFRAYDTTGQEVVFKRNTAGDTANAFGISSPVAIATATTFYVTALA